MKNYRMIKIYKTRYLIGNCMLDLNLNNLNKFQKKLPNKDYSNRHKKYMV